ncbi:putative subunit of proteaseome activator complex [Gigaspora margarita]|uniref:Putative subunit of proteaseome activator complex n=1 Tax=Gigaspora margarita TaxID=4874 RepID=A0A8H4A9E6_GIGMA|nr:putative subunit of proteaseome activator complex [Gigaspora margarita]
MSQSDHFAVSSNPQNLDQFHSKLKIQSLEIINQIFPRKILELSNLLQYQKEGSITDLNFSPLTQKDDAKSRKRRRNEINDHSQIVEDVESVLCDAIHMTNNDNTENNNDNIMCLNNGNDYFRIKELHKILEDEVACFAGYCCKLRAWVTLKYPRIGTEENPKISAQEDITAELSRVEDSSFLFLDSITRYYVARTKLCKTYYKFPTIQDSHHALNHLDKQHLISILHHLEDMCNIYVIIYDMLQKNMIYLT